VLNYPDVSSINSLLPDNTRVAGKMESILQVSGSLKTPEVTVKTKLTGGRFTASDIGLLIEIEGDVAVDKASLLVGVEPGVILESEDLVVLGEEVRKDTAQLSLDVGIDFGDNTLIDASGLNGRLSGAPRLRTGANNLLVSSGEIRVLDGKFNLFGEELIVSKGKFLDLLVLR